MNIHKYLAVSYIMKSESIWSVTLADVQTLGQLLSQIESFLDVNQGCHGEDTL